MSAPWKQTLKKAVAGERLTLAEGVALFDCKDLQCAGPGRRRRRAPPASGAVPHLQHRPQHQLHQRLRRGLRLLRLLPQEHRRRRLRPAARSALQEDRGNDRPGRRPGPAARRQPSDAEAGMVRGAAARSEGALSRRSICTPSALRRSGTFTSSTSCRSRRCCNGSRTPAWAACRAAAARSSSIASARRSPSTSA